MVGVEIKAVPNFAYRSVMGCSPVSQNSKKAALYAYLKFGIWALQEVLWKSFIQLECCMVN